MVVSTSLTVQALACMVLCLVGLASANVPISNPTSTRVEENHNQAVHGCVACSDWLCVRSVEFTAYGARGHRQLRNRRASCPGEPQLHR